MDTPSKALTKPLIQRFYRITKTVYQLLHDRGYLIFEEDLTMSLKKFKKSFKSIEEHIIYSSHENDPDNTILVIFDHNDYNPDLVKKVPLLKLGEMTDMCARHNQYHESSTTIKKKIIITNRKLATNASKYLNSPSGQDIEVFYEQELLINITDHTLVGIFKLLSAQEKVEMLKKYKITEQELPRIEKEDNISRYFGARQGDVFKVIRKSDIAGRYLYYRIVQ